MPARYWAWDELWEAGPRIAGRLRKKGYHGFIVLTTDIGEGAELWVNRPLAPEDEKEVNNIICEEAEKHGLECMPLRPIEKHAKLTPEERRRWKNDLKELLRSEPYISF